MKNNTLNKVLASFTLLAIAFSGSSFAEIYKRVDADGRITYSNIKTKGATRLEFDPDANMIGNGSAKKPVGGGGDSKRTATPASFPKVDKETQTNRDGKRKDILKNELDSEKTALEQAKQAYKEGGDNPEMSKNAKGQSFRNVPKFEEKMKTLQADVDSHENNIKLLEKELAEH